MNQPIKTGAELVAEIQDTRVTAPTLWWLGHSGFAVKFANILFFVDPCLCDVPGRARVMPPPFSPRQVTAADLILCSHAHALHMDGSTLNGMLQSSHRAKVVLPKSAAAHARSLGIAFERMTTTDADLRVEYFKEGQYGRVYAVPSAHERLDRTAVGGFPYLGYLIRFGGHTIYHAGDCVMYDDLAQRLKPYNVTVALLPIAGRNFSVQEAAQLAEEIGARWLIPMHYGTFSGDLGDVNRFIEHMLGQRPDQRFKVFQCGERWTVPD
jgi:L-ascorbate metabolism protein UlaG (beta-lactamase superfamily)